MRSISVKHDTKDGELLITRSFDGKFFHSRYELNGSVVSKRRAMEAKRK